MYIPIIIVLLATLEDTNTYLIPLAKTMSTPKFYQKHNIIQNKGTLANTKQITMDLQTGNVKQTQLAIKAIQPSIRYSHHCELTALYD